MVWHKNKHNVNNPLRVDFEGVIIRLPVGQVKCKFYRKQLSGKKRLVSILYSVLVEGEVGVCDMLPGWVERVENPKDLRATLRKVKK
ncbi:MAG TPA: hypothetical protein IGQ44_00675 [Geminocystis sp. M7585_C2015_104]|nr:hypothetical protein [Geminocystis sp. M7585_C2015_104]